MKKSKRIETLGLISNTFQSPFYAYYMSFRSLGIQKSNASNGTQIRAEMKKLWPLEDNCTKLKGNFANCEINLFLRNRHFQLAKFSQVMLQAVKSTCVLPDICDRLCQVFFFRYLLFKSLFSPCNPPIIGFLSQEVRKKGE